MGLLDTLLGNQAQQQEYQDFADRYQQGAPHEGYSDQEVSQRYQQVAPHLSQQEYEQSAEQSFSRLSPLERTQFGQRLQQHAKEQNYTGPGVGQNVDADQSQDPRYLAQMTGQIHQQQPGLLEGLLGGGSGAGLLGSPVARAALAGIAATAVSRALGGGMGGGLAGGALGGLLGQQRG